MYKLEHAKHLLKCKHCLGSHAKTYFMRCLVLKETPGKKTKIIVFGKLYWGGDNQRVRYVEPNRIFEDLKMNAVRKPTFTEMHAANPNPYESTIIARAQSILTSGGEVGPVLSYDQACDVVNWFDRQEPQK